MPSHSRTLAGRLATTQTAVAIIAVAIAMVTAMLLADTLIVTRVEDSVSAAARVMQVELDEQPEEVSHVEEEARVLGIDGRVAVVKAGRVLHGDQGMPAEVGQGCWLSEGASGSELICGAPLSAWPGAMVLVAVPTERVHGHRPALLLAAGIALVVVAAVARGVGGALAQRLLAPLDRLRGAVADADAASPQTMALPPRTGLEEIDALREALASLSTRLGEELGRARRFAASAAHELRTPLAKMRAELELASESPVGDDARERALPRLIRTTARLETLTERLLVLATPHDALAGDHCTSLAQVVEDLVERRFGEHADRLRLEVCEGDALVRGDEHLLAAMLDNLVDNALKFSEGPVRVAVAEDEQEVVLDVDDEGPGVPVTAQHELFEPFRRGSGAHGPGHGLGLALVRHVVRASGGRVAFVRKREVGTSVRVCLPRL
ncbi:sensor histidine kinase [Paraliomyxa miuraensis]|uniref:sensor histidine kinase n=1 Tax=Paraliomyxa miuraensis TaxID=376150 RepID=UPI002255BA29|nr:HAMP domain-containing sensor histidine kinase [Paraliomyxa miuraensis]MCX4248113.1 HAMP domain-containing histidine kinase [Paraliomyxa miuraensis]